MLVDCDPTIMSQLRRFCRRSDVTCGDNEVVGGSGSGGDGGNDGTW